MGVARVAARMPVTTETMTEYGKMFENYIFMELKAYIDYKATDDELYFWRSRDGYEVDFIIDKKVAIEIKTSNLTDDFLNKVSKVFLNNKTIINFNLVNNSIGYDSICKLSLCLTKNNSINEVKLLLNQPNPEEREKLMSSSSHIIFN